MKHLTYTLAIWTVEVRRLMIILQSYHQRIPVNLQLSIYMALENTPSGRYSPISRKNCIPLVPEVMEVNSPSNQGYFAVLEKFTLNSDIVIHPSSKFKLWDHFGLKQKPLWIKCNFTTCVLMGNKGNIELLLLNLLHVEWCYNCEHPFWWSSLWKKHAERPFSLVAEEVGHWLTTKTVKQ